MTQQECNIDKIIEALTSLEKTLPSPTSKEANVNNSEQSSGRGSDEKRSLCDWVIGRVKKIGKASNHASDSGGGSSQGGSRRGRRNIEDDDEEDAELEIRKLQSDIRQMRAAFENLTQFQTKMRKNLERDLPLTKLSGILEKTVSIKSRSHDLKEIRRKVFNMKCEIPSLLYKQSSRGLSVTDSETAEENGEIVETGSDIYLPSLHVYEKFKDSLAFEEIKEKFEELDFTHQQCLLSFAVFPENREIKRTMLMYWWIGEEFILCDDDPENSVKKILDELSKKGLLEPVEDERKLKPNSYKMEPHVHSAVVHLAEKMDIFKVYSKEETLTTEKSSRQKICLVKGSSLVRAAKTYVKPKTLLTIFNSSERYPDFTFKWFQQMDSLRVLYLGRWEQTAKRHIEVESTNFLKDIKSLKNLRLASFQGISRIEQLEKNICKLRKLVILDLKACYNLEGLPEDIGSLESLIYLDVSECYMLDRMPIEIEDLSKLQVLKGFVISQSDDESNCAVKKLVKLRKLSITVNKESFKVEKLMESLRGLEQLESLKIAWGARPEEEKRETTNEEKENKGGPATDKKHKDLKEQEDDQMQQKGQASEEKKGDVEETGKRDDGASSKIEDGRNEEANLEEGKKHDEVKAESLKSDKVEKKISPSQEATDTIQNKPDDQKGETKVEEEEDGDKGKADLEERKKQDEVEAERSKSDKVVEGEKKASPTRESSDIIQKKPDDKSKVEKEGDGDKEKADLDEEKKQDEVEADKSKSDKVVEGEKKASPPRESSDMIQNKPDGKSKVEKEEDGDKEKADPEEGKKRDEVGTESSKSENVVEGDEKISPPQESKDTIQNKTTDKTKVEKEGDGAKGKANPEEGEKHDEVEAESTKSYNGVEGVKKTNPSRESTDAIQNKPDDHQRGDKQEEKGGGEKEKVNLDEGKKTDEVKAESSKPDKVIEGDEKKSPPKHSLDTIQSKTDDHREISKVQEKGDGEKKGDDVKKLDEVEAKTQKSDKTSKLRKKVSFSENTEALIQKKLDDLKRDNAMGKESHETPSPSKTPEESGSGKTKLKRKLTQIETALDKKTKKWLRALRENPPIHTSELPSSLKKLELECFPEKDRPSWLNPQSLKNLEKLSIRGGKLSRISDEHPTEENEWPVKILRLKYLHEFKVEWRDLQTLFPKMILLEKYKCPKIALCPTDGNGVWRSKPQKSPNM